MISRTRWIGAAFILVTALSLPLQKSSARPLQRGSLESQFQKAVSYYNSGQFQAAARVLEILERRAATSFEVEELLGLVYSAESKNREAYLHFEKAVRLRPESAAARANLAVGLARLGKNTLAEAEFKRAIQAEPGNFSANHNFGEFYARTGRAKDAIPYLRRAQQAQPSSYGNGYDLALAYTQSGMWEDARKQIRDLLKLQDAAELHRLMGEVEEKSGNYLAAANEFQRAAQMEPSELNIFYWGSELLLHQTLNPAIEVFSEGAKRYPKSPRLAVGLGLALYWSGKYDDAVEALVRATDLSPSDPRPYYFLSKAYQHSHSQADRVISRFQRFEQLRPHDSQAAYYYAMSIWKGKQTVGASPFLIQVESLLHKAVHLDPSFAQAYLELGNLYSQQHRYEDAVPEYQQSIQLDARLVDAYYRLGQAYVHLRQPELAKKEFQIHQRLYQQHLVKWDSQQQDIRHFVYTRTNDRSGP